MSTLSASLRYQVPLAVPVIGGTLHTPLPGQSARLTLPVDWDHFWTVTRPDLFDVVLTAADGVTVLPLHRLTANPSARDLTLDVTGWTAPSGQAVCLLWLHFGDPNTTTDPTTGPAATTPLPAALTLARPGGWLTAHRDPGRGTRTDTFVKRPEEVRDLWVRFAGMAQRRSTSRGVLGLEWPSYAAVTVTDRADPPEVQPSMTDPARLRFAGSQYVRLDVRGGAAGQDYDLSLSLTTTLGQRLVFPAVLSVRS